MGIEQEVYWRHCYEVCDCKQWMQKTWLKTRLKDSTQSHELRDLWVKKWCVWKKKEKGTGIRKGTLPWQSFSYMQPLRSGSNCCSWPWLCFYGHFEEEWPLGPRGSGVLFSRRPLCYEINLTGRQGNIDRGVVEVCLRKLTLLTWKSPGPGEVAYVCVCGSGCCYLSSSTSISESCPVLSIFLLKVHTALPLNKPNPGRQAFTVVLCQMYNPVGKRCNKPTENLEDGVLVHASYHEMYVFITT